MVEPVNVIGGGNLNREIDLNEVASQFDCSEDVTAEFAENAPWQLLIRFKQGGMAILYRTGKYILRGGSSFESLEEVKRRFFSILEDESIIETKKSVTYSLQNVVFLEEFDSNIELAQAAIELGLNQTEYEPEQFPGLIYRPPELEVVCLVFATGKVIITGTVDEMTATEAAKTLQEQLT